MGERGRMSVLRVLTDRRTPLTALVMLSIWFVLECVYKGMPPEFVHSRLIHTPSIDSYTLSTLDLPGLNAGTTRRSPSSTPPNNAARPTRTRASGAHHTRLPPQYRC